MYVLNPLKTENVPESKLFQKGSKQVYLMTVCAFYEKGQRPNISVLLIVVRTFCQSKSDVIKVSFYFEKLARIAEQCTKC